MFRILDWLWFTFETPIRVLQFVQANPGDFVEWLKHRVGFHGDWCHFGAGDSCVISGRPAKYNVLVRLWRWIWEDVD